MQPRYRCFGVVLANKTWKLYWRNLKMKLWDVRLKRYISSFLCSLSISVLNFPISTSKTHLAGVPPLTVILRVWAKNISKHIFELPPPKYWRCGPFSSGWGWFCSFQPPLEVYTQKKQRKHVDQFSTFFLRSPYYLASAVLARAFLHVTRSGL
jgi:hypothetical protein